jgi:ribonuclease BN (tRNA processing enzyme)
MKLVLLGVRGSTPSPGADFIRYGGHTSSVAVIPDGASDPSLVLDAGTGLRHLSTRLEGRPFIGSIVLTHLHWDHMQGLPFFAAGDRDDAEVDAYVPAQEGLSGHDLLAKSMSIPNFPIEPEELRGSWRFHAMESGIHEIEGFRIDVSDVAHKGGRTFGIRVQDAHGSIAYLPDHVPAHGCSAETLDLLSGVDVLLHDAQFIESERRIAEAYGHATIDDACALASQAGVGTLVLIHHSPVRSDEALDQIAHTYESDAPLRIRVGREGDVIHVPWTQNAH